MVVSKDVETNIKYWIGEIDKKLSSQLNEILHHPEFQKLEATWRGLHYLVHQSETGESLKIRVLNVTKRDLFKDLEKAAEFDQSALFKKIYEEEYGQLGGQPYGMLVGDYDFGRGPEDISLLKMISNVAAASHAPFVAATSPKMFNFDSFTELANPRDVAKQCPTEVAITYRREFELSNLGFLPLIHAKGTDYAVFMGAQSCQKPKTYFDPDANANAELSAKFNLIMCTSRFAHYLKVMARDKIGSFMEVKDCAAWLNKWINNYCVNPAGASDETKARRPLAQAEVDVREVKGKPGWYEAVAYLRPHFQLETLSTSMRLVAEVPKKA